MTSELHPRLSDEARLRLDQRYTTRRTSRADRRIRGLARVTADRREARRPEL